MDLVATCLAPEGCLPGAIAAFRMPAAAALLAGVPGVLFDNLDTSERCLVADESEKLRKGPGVQHAVDLPGLLGAVSDAKQLLDMQNAAVSSHGIDDLPADAVVLAPGPSGLSSLAALDHAGLALALESLTVAKVPSARVAQRLAVEEPDDARSGEDGEVGEAQIKAEVRTVMTGNLLGLDGQHEVPILASLDDFRDPVRQLDEVLPDFGYKHRKPQEPLGRGNPDDALVRKDAQVLDREPQGQEPAEPWLRCLVFLASSCLHGPVD